jgi:hypothetical protein
MNVAGNMVRQMVKSLLSNGPLRWLMPTDFKKQLGRWCTEIDVHKIERRAYWANEDHCGACGNPWDNASESDSDKMQEETRKEIRQEKREEAHRS